MILEVENLAYRYHNGPAIFQDINFRLEQGEILSILGTNGAGKSTLLNCLGNLYTPCTGEIRLDGTSMRRLPLTQVSRLVGYVPQIHYPVYAYSVRNFVVMGRTPYIGAFSRPKKEDYEKADQALEKLHISHLAEKAYTEISGGERQQVTIARALAQEPKVILLDEPTAHLDYGNQIRTVRLIRELADEGYGVIMTTHNPDHVLMLGGKVGVLDREGRMEFGDAGVILTEEKLSRLYQVRLRLVQVEGLDREACVASMSG